MSYDENYSSYLKAMGIPFFLVPLILGSKETIIMTRPENPEGFWTINTITGTSYIYTKQCILSQDAIKL